MSYYIVSLIAFSFKNDQVLLEYKPNTCIAMGELKGKEIYIQLY